MFNKQTDRVHLVLPIHDLIGCISSIDPDQRWEPHERKIASRDPVPTCLYDLTRKEPMMAHNIHNISFRTLSSSSPSAAWQWPVIILAIGTFMALLDGSIVNIAIPHIEAAFGVNTLSVQWIVTVYLLTMGAIIPITGYLSDKWGPRQIYLVSLGLFTLGSCLAGLAPSLAWLIVFRILQAIGGGLIIPLTQALIYRLVPSDRLGRAMGWWGLSVVMAPALGPVLGGYLIQSVSWRLIFFINVPIGILGLILAYGSLPHFKHGKSQRFDGWGMVLSSGGLFGVLLVLSQAPRWGWMSETSLLTGVFSFTALVLFTLWELRIPHPLLDLRVMRHKAFVLANIVMFVSGLGLNAMVFYVPLYLQTVAGRSPLNAGLQMMPQALMIAVVMPLAGRLYNRVGARWLVMAGLIVQAWGTWLLHDLGPITPFQILAEWLMIRGMGRGLYMMPLVTAGMQAVKTEEAVAASVINNVVQRISGSFGLALMVALVQNRTAVHLNRLSAALTPQSPQSTALLHKLHILAVKNGMASHAIAPWSLTLISGWLQSQAFGLSIDDLAIAVTGLTALAAILACVLPSTRNLRDTKQ